MPRSSAPASLAALQAGFAAALRRQKAGLPIGIAGPGGGAPPTRRFDVHRNTMQAGLVEAFLARFPVVARLVGDAFFRAAACRFVLDAPPRSPALLDYGGDFADFLAGFEPAWCLPYLPDVARLEWLRHSAYHAADAESMPPAALAAIPGEIVGGIVLRLHPSCGLIASAYPVVSIWETNSADARVREIGPDLPGEAALILRPRLEVMTLRLGAGGGVFLAEIGQGASLGDAAGRASESAATFSLAEVLGTLLSAGAFTGYVGEKTYFLQGDMK